VPPSSTPPVTRVHLSAADRPARLTGFDTPVESVDVLGSLEARRAVAIVGSREPTPEAEKYARRLASKLAGHGAVVVSGGARGIDCAAHEGALDAGGKTWCVLPSSEPQITPKSSAPLVRRIASSDGTVVWLGHGKRVARGHFLQRNRILVGLADAVVVVQATKAQSGSLNAAMAARSLGRQLFVVSPAPWLDRAHYTGNVVELARGYARAHFDDELLLHQLGFAKNEPPPAPSASAAQPSSTLHDKVELAILAALDSASPTVLHIDEIVSKIALPYSASASALLTLCLEAVVVEGPGGFYRRRPAPLAGAVGK
jgi:DNA processing protein